MERLILLSHVAAGVLVLLTGFMNFLTAKGSKLHRRIGLLYVAGMSWIFVSALLIISFYRFSPFLLVIAVLSFYATFCGYRVTKRKKPGQERWYDWAASALTSLFGLGLVVYGSLVAFSHGAGQPLAILSWVFGVATAYNAYEDLRLFMKPDEKLFKLWWLDKHIGAIGGSYIAAVTAFAVQNGERLMSDSDYQWLLWIIPAILGAPAIAIFQRRFKTKKRYSKGAESTPAEPAAASD